MLVEYQMPVGITWLVDLLYSRVPPLPLEVSETLHEVLLLAVAAKVCVLLTTGAEGFTYTVLVTCVAALPAASLTL